MLIKLENNTRYKPGDIRCKTEKALLEVCKIIDEEELADVYEKLLNDEVSTSKLYSVLHKPYRRELKANKISPKTAVQKTIIDEIRARGKKNEKANEIAERFEFMSFNFDEKNYFNNISFDKKFHVKQLSTAKEIMDVARICDTCINPDKLNEKAREKVNFDIWEKDKEGTLFLKITWKEDYSDFSEKHVGYSRVYFYHLRNNSYKDGFVVAGIDTTEINSNYVNWLDYNSWLTLPQKHKLIGGLTIAYLLIVEAEKRKIDYILPSVQMCKWCGLRSIVIRGKLEKIGEGKVFSYTAHYKSEKNRCVATDCISKHFLNYAEEILSL